MHIDCLSPATILSPSMRTNILRYGNYYLDGVRYVPAEGWYMTFPTSKFRTIMKKTPIEDFDRCFVEDFDGNRLPLFMAVGCGKCACCRDKKVKEWSCRAMCETQSSTGIPYFVTLTYNDNCLPRNGIRKGAIQRFLKRLRINYERMTGNPSNIRYFMCGEYGSRTKRPHYHGILWNIDILDADAVDELVQKSWCFSVKKKYYKTLPDLRSVYGKPILKYQDDRTYRVMYGFTRCLPLEKGGYQYVMKYMRKDCDIPRGCNPLFFLASRRGGLGRQWLEGKLKEFRSNPNLLSVKLTDKFTGELYEGTMPTYFKNIIAPPPSRIICKEVRDAFIEYDDIYRTISREFTYCNTMRERVLAHYPSLYSTPSLRINKPTTSTYSELVKQLICRADELEYFLLSYCYDIEMSLWSPKYKILHSKAAAYALQSLHPMPPAEHAAQIKRIRSRSIRKELF